MQNAYRCLQQAQQNYCEDTADDLEDSRLILRFRDIAGGFSVGEFGEDLLEELECLEGWVGERAVYYRSGLPFEEDLGFYYRTAGAAYSLLNGGVQHLIAFLDDGDLSRLEEGLALAEAGERTLKELELEVRREGTRFLEDHAWVVG